MSLFITFLAAATFCIVHVIVGRLTILDREPHHSNWVSFGGGMAIAYVFVYLLPKLAAMQPYLQASTEEGLLGFLEHHVYFVAMAGITLYLGIARAGTVLAPDSGAKRGLAVRFRKGLAFADVAGAAVYYVLVGYLVSELTRPYAVMLITGGLALHFMAIDHDFRHRYRESYDTSIRWIFCAATLTGWVIGALTVVSELVLAVWTAFLAGGVTMNALREELPGNSQLRFWPFFFGVAFFSALVLFVRTL